MGEPRLDIEMDVIELEVAIDAMREAQRAWDGGEAKSWRVETLQGLLVRMMQAKRSVSWSG